MKRSLRVLSGIVVLLALVFASGFVLGGTARADGTLQPPSYDDNPPSGPADMRYLLSDNDAGRRTSTETTEIKSNVTVTSKKYDSNVLIYPGVTFTAGTNANIVINGDLAIFGTFKITSGSVTVNGDIINLGTFSAGGTSKVIVNKASAVKQKAGYPGAHFLSAGLVSITGSANITTNYVDAQSGFYTYGYLVMNSATAKLTVNGIFTADGESTAGDLTAGTLVVNGDFYQQNEYSNASFCTSGSFTVQIIGAAGKKRTVVFDSPGGSYFTNYTFTNVVFSAASKVSFKKTLTANLSISCGDAKVAFQGSLNGKALTITSKYIYPGAGASLTLGGGTLTTYGICILDPTANLIMSNANDKLVTMADLISMSNNTANLIRGTLEIRGSFKQSNPYPFTPGPAFKTKIVGANRDVRFENIETSYFTLIELASGSSIEPACQVSIKQDLANDIRWSFADLYFRGNLNGHMLQNIGNLTIPAGNTLTVGGSLLQVIGNLTVQGSLVETNASDSVYVTGNFTANGSGSSEGSLTNGKLYIGGNFTQNGHVKSFRATDNHTTILSGSGAQTVTFHVGNTISDSKFAHLVVLNDSLDPDALPNYYDDKTVSGLTFDGIGLNNGATLKPVFGPTVYEYTVVLPKGTDNVTITPSFLDRYSGNEYLTIWDGAELPDHLTDIEVTDVLYDEAKTVTVYAHTDNNLLLCSYIFHVMQLNADIGDLGTLPEGSVVDQPIDPDTMAYTVQLPETVASFTFAPQAAHPNSTVSIEEAGSAASATVALDPGKSATYTVHVLGQDESTQRVYTVEFTRRNPVANITVSSGTLSFNPATATYTVNVPSTTASVTVTAVKTEGGDGDWSKFEINDVEQESIVLSPVAGASATARIETWDLDGKTVTTYTVTVKRVAMLTAITPSVGTLSPAFDPTVFAYKVCVPNTTATVRITPAKVNGVTMRINGAAVSYVNLSIPSGGSNAATIVCTYGAGAQLVSQTFKVTVYRILPIAGMTVAGGTLAPAFSPTVTNYTISVPATTAAVTVTPVKTASCKSLTVNGTVVTNYVFRPAVGGSLSVTFRATAQNNVVYSYTVTVRRAPLITGITPGTGALSPAFNAAVLAYTVNVPATVTQVKITPVKASTGVKSVTINGVAASYAMIKPPVGGSATATIMATATDGRTKVTYTVVVKRASLISGIGVTGGTLSPAFDPMKPAYTINIPANAASVKITPVKTAYCKTMLIDSKAVAYKTVTPAAGSSVTVTISATATDGVTKQAYTVKVVRHRPLTGIGVSAGSLTPVFSSTTLNYSVSVPGGTASVTVTPTRATGYSYSINGGALNTPATIPVEPNGTAAATVRATYPGGTMVYTVTIRRGSLLTGISVVDEATGPPTAYSLSPAFSAGQLTYDVTVPGGVAELKITPVVAAGCHYSINGTDADTPYELPVSPGEAETATIVVTGPGEAEATYTVTVHRENLMLDITNDYLSMDFDPLTADYTVNVAGDIASVVVTATASTGCTVTFDGVEADSVTLEPESGEDVTTTIVVTTPAPELLTRTYTVTVRRGAALESITVNGTGLTGFDPARRSYEIHADMPDAGELGESVTIAVTNSDSTDVTMNGDPVVSYVLSMPDPDTDTATVTIVVTPDNGMDPVTYTVTVVWDR